MKTLPLIISIAAFALSSCTSVPEEPRLVAVALGYSSTSVNAAIFRANSLDTHGDTQYITFYDAEGWLTLGKRLLGSGEWTLHRSQYKGNVTDGHNVISMMVDGDGYIHVAFDHHGHPLHYCRSIAPDSLALGDLMEMTGVDEADVTYPEFHHLSGGDLLFVYRSGASGRGNMVMNRYSVSERRWTRVQDILIDGEGERNAYWQTCVDATGTIHVSWVWRETWLVETNHDLCYARSSDGGVTWQNSRGETYALPINIHNAEIACPIPQCSELINQTSMTADADGHPYIATYWRDADSEVPQYRMVWHDGSEWRTRQVSERTTPFSLSGGGTKMIPIARPRLTVDEAGEAWYIFRDVERGSRVSAYRGNVNGTLTAVDLTTFAVNAWEPSIDTELWKTRHQLHIYVQDVRQGDGERTEETEPQTVYVLECPLK